MSPRTLHRWQNLDSSLLLLITISFILLLLIAILPIYPSSIETPAHYRKPIAGAGFTVILALGMTAVFFPKKCSKVSAFGVDSNKLHVQLGSASVTESDGVTASLRETSVRGHHPSCQLFQHHKFQVCGRTLCAACTGLFIGAITAVVVTTLFFFNGWNPELTPHTVLLGVIGVALGLLQPLLYDKCHYIVRISVNSYFVLGASLILIGFDAMLRSLTADFLAVAGSVFWLFTRIKVSRFRHDAICRGCASKCRV